MSEKKCSSCGATIDLNATECRYCGAAVANGRQEYENVHQQNFRQSGNDTRFSYLKNYYKLEFEMMEQSGGQYKGKWNWCAFFFSWIWGFTKGLWGLSLTTILIAAVFSAARISWLGLAISVFWGIRGNYFYYNLTTKNKQFPDSL